MHPDLVGHLLLCEAELLEQCGQTFWKAHGQNEMDGNGQWCRARVHWHSFQPVTHPHIQLVEAAEAAADTVIIAAYRCPGALNLFAHSLPRRSG